MSRFSAVVRTVILAGVVAGSATYLAPRYWDTVKPLVDSATSLVHSVAPSVSDLLDAKPIALTGTYICTKGSIVRCTDPSRTIPFGQPVLPSSPFFPARSFSISQQKNSYILDEGNRFTLQTDGSGEFAFSRIWRTGALEGNGNLDKNGHLSLLVNQRDNSGYCCTVAFTCFQLPSSKQKPEPDAYRAVFIRPCPCQFYKSVPSQKGEHPVTNVGDGSIGGVCRDLVRSRVTDVFLAFKTDHEGKGCGKSGELLYDSTVYDAYENPDFQNARTIGFDPLGDLMRTCKKIYKTAGKTIRFHAWFPVFKDRFAAGIEGQKAIYGDPFSAFFRSVLAIPNYESRLFANPAHPAVAAYQLALLKELVQTYPLDGINLDYIRYSGTDDDPDAPAGSQWVVDDSAIADFVRNVRENFPALVLSADVMAGEPRRSKVGQESMMADLDWIMPMMYRDFGVTAEQIGPLVRALHDRYPSKTLIPILRGWGCDLDCNGHGNCTLLPGPLKAHLREDIHAVFSNRGRGYAVFTYENLVLDMNARTLREIDPER